MTTDKSINVLCSCGKDCGAKESGVQAIPDDFLEWFVNNPSCEQISVEEVYFHGSGYYKASELSEQEKEKYSFMKEYKIIIPKEESKQEICEYLKEVGCIKDICSCNTRPKQETLEVVKKEQIIEQASEYYAHNYFDMHETNNYKALKEGFIDGANWQQEKILKFILDEDNHTESELVNPSIDVQKLVLFIEQFKTKNSK